MGNRPKRRTPRAVRYETWRRPVADPSEALSALNDAKGRLTLAQVGGISDELREPLEEAVAKARREVDACFEEVRLRKLRADQYEALMAEHPPTEQDEADGLLYHDASFLPALLAEIGDNDWTEEDWTEEIAELSVGERKELREAATYVQTRTWSQQVPKD